MLPVSLRVSLQALQMMEAGVEHLAQVLVVDWEA